MTTPLDGRKIAHLTTVDTSLRHLLLAQLIGARDAGASVLGISAPGRWVADLESHGVRHIPLPGSTRSMSLRADLQAAIGLWRILRRERPDVLHTHNPKPGIYGRIVGRLAGVPVVVNTVHGLYATSDDHLLKRLGVYALEGVASRFSDMELIQNEEDLALMRRARLASPRKLRLLGNGVDLERFVPTPADIGPGSLRDRLSIPPDTVVIGMVGRLVEEKGLRELIRAAEILDGDHVIVVAGGSDGEKADSLGPTWLRRAQDAGIVFLGHHDDMPDFYNACDVVVLPSYREGVPRGLMEAAASGRPLVATDVRGCRQVVQHGVNGLLVPPRDADALADAMGQLLRSADEREQFGRAARARAEELFDERAVVDRIVQAHAALLASVPQRSSLRPAAGQRRSRSPSVETEEQGPIDVLWVIKCLGLGGAERLVAALAARRSPHYRLHVAYLVPCEGRFVRELEEMGVQVHRIRPGSAWPLGVVRLLRSVPFQIVHTHSPLLSAFARLGLWRTQTALLHTEHNTWSSYHPATRLVHRLTFRRNDRVLAVSEAVERSIPNRASRWSPIEVVYHGFDDRAVELGPAARATARSLLDAPSDAFLVGTVGNLRWTKDHETLIRAFAGLRESMASARLVIVGDGPLRPVLEAVIDDLGLGPSVCLLGSRTDVASLLPGFDTFAMSSVEEGLPLALLEAMAAGLPVVATRVGGIPEVLIDGEHGLVVDPRDPIGLTAAMARLAGDDELRSQLGRAGRERVSQFSVSRAIATVEDRYREVLGRPPGAATTGAPPDPPRPRSHRGGSPGAESAT